MYTKALQFAIKAHKGQLRKHTGAPYVTHPIRVAEAVDNEYQAVLALLHDTIEDTEVKYDDLVRDFDEDTAEDVLLLSHLSGTYKEYITRIADGNRDVIIVKIADIMDNLSDHPSDYMLEKSVWALETLRKAL